MAFTVANKIAQGFTSPGATSATSSWTPAANHLYLLWAFQNSNAATTNAPTASGNGITWVQVATFQFNTSNESRLTLLRGMVASPSAGATTVTWNTSPVEGGVVIIDDWDGIDTSGTNGSGAIVQSTTGTGTTTSASFSFGSVTSGNAVTAAFANGSANGATNDTVGSGFTKVGESFHTTSPDWDGHMMSEWKAAQTSIAATIGDLAGTPGWGSIAVEILAASSGGTAPPQLGNLFVGFPMVA